MVETLAAMFWTRLLPIRTAMPGLEQIVVVEGIGGSALAPSTIDPGVWR